MKQIMSALIIFVATISSAAEKPAVKDANKQVAASVDLAKSTLAWKATKKVKGGHDGMITIKSATAEMKNNKIVSGEFVVDMKSFTVNELEGEWKQKFLTHVAGPDFFDVDKYPTAKLTIKGQDSDNKIKGEMTIKDKTQPVQVEFKKEGNSYVGTLVFDRTKYGVVYGSGNFFKELTADKIINNDVEVKFNIVTK